MARWSVLIFSLLFSLGEILADQLFLVGDHEVSDVTVLRFDLNRVRFRRRGMRPEEIERWRVKDILFSQAPRQLKQGRVFLRQNDWGSARKQLLAVTDPRFQEEAAWWAAYALAQLARERGQQLDKAVKELQDFVATWEGKKGWRVPDALWLLGLLACEKGKADVAQKAFGQLGQLPGTRWKILARAGEGLVALAQGQAQEAASALNTALAECRDNQLTDLYRQLVPYRGKALIAQKRYSEAIRFLSEYIKKPSGQIVLDRYLARAYNVLGDAFRARGAPEDKEEALYRYLWTTVLFRAWRAECAEAFAKAAQLAAELGMQEDSQKLRERLRAEYGDISWATKAK